MHGVRNVKSLFKCSVLPHREHCVTAVKRTS